MAEIELKLRAQPDQLDALHKALAAISGARMPAPKTLKATYYDTKARDLLRGGLTLRVRREGDAYIQTVKSAGRTLTKRGEWSDTLPDAQPDVKAKVTGKRLRGVLRSQVRPQFKVDVNRTAYAIHVGDKTLIEAAIDEGVISMPGKDKAQPHDRIAEVELELKSGDPAALYTLALKLLAVAPLTIETRSKSARGYSLGKDKTPKFIKITPYTVDPKESIDDVLHRAGLRYLAQCLRNIPAVLSDSVEGIHQMRVSLRRLRSLLSAFKKELPAESSAWANAKLKGILQALGPAREWDVFLGEMVEVMEETGQSRNRAAFERVAGIARMRAHLRARDAVASPAHTTAILELLRWFEARGWRTVHGAEIKKLDRPIGKHAGKLVDRQFQRARERGKNFAKLPIAERHVFRIAIKALRYTVELLAPALRSGKTTVFLKSLKPLQERLGHLNDIATAERLLTELTNQDTSPAVALRGGVMLGWHEARARAGEQQLCRLVDKFRNIAPFW